MLLPPDLRDWIRSDHIVHFIIDAVDHSPPNTSAPISEERAMNSIHPA